MTRPRPFALMVLAACTSGDANDGPGPASTGMSASNGQDASSNPDASGPGSGSSAPSTSASDGPGPDGTGGSDGADTTTGLPPGDPFECDALGDTVVFCSDFEEGDFSIWDDFDGNPPETNTLLEHGGPFDLAGNHVGRIRVPPGNGGADFVKELPAAHDRLYARWYILYEDGFDFAAPNHGGGLHAGSRDFLGQSGNRPQGDDWFSSWIEYEVGEPRFQAYTYARGMYQDCADPNGACWGDHFPCTSDEGEVYCTAPQHRETVAQPTLEAGRWYCVEMLLDGGTPSTDGSIADGQLDIWVDDLELGPWTDLWLRTTSELQPSLLWLSLFHHAEHSVEGVMYDQVVVATERIGCP